MSTIVLRQVKGTPLTVAEVDSNFSNLNTDKLEKSGGTMTGAITFAAAQFGTNVNTFLTTPSSANLLAALTDETGTGANVFATSPTLVTPILGTPTSGNFSTGTFTWPTFNQNTSGTAAGLSATLVVGSGGTGLSSVGTSGNLLTSNGTSWVSSAPSVSILNTAVTPGTSGNVLTSNGTSWVSSTPTGGSGLFNTSISASVGYAVTTSSAAAFTAPATASRRYIVHSIHVTNIGTVAANITTELTGTTYSSGISLSNTLPVPVGGAVELLKKPKVMQPSDVINMLSDQASTLHATIIYETSTDVKYFGSGVDVTTDATYTDLYTMTADSVLESVLVVNDSIDSDSKVTLVWTNGSNVIQGYYAYDFIIALDSTVELLEKPKFVTSGYKLRIQSNVGNRVEAIVAGKTV
jgi:hypothetical protein